MLKDACVLVDVGDLLSIIDPERQYPSAAVELLFVRSYMRSTAIPCVSASLLSPDVDPALKLCGPVGGYHDLAKTVAKQRINVLDYLPPEVTELADPCGLYFMLWRYTLIIGSRRAVEKQWRNLRYRSW